MLISDRDTHRALETLCREIPDGFTVTITPPAQTAEQKKKYHVLITEIAKQLIYLGRKWRERDMKLLLLAEFRKESMEDPLLQQYWTRFGDLELVPDLAGTGVIALGDQTRQFDKELSSAFIEWLFAFSTRTGIDLSRVRERDTQSSEGSGLRPAA